MWSSRISGTGTPFGCGVTTTPDLGVAPAIRIDGGKRVELGLARRRRLGWIVDLQRESRRGDDLVDRHARVNAVERRPAA